MRSRATAAVLAGAALISGCGAATTDTTKNFKGVEGDVANVVKDLADATAKRDSKKICADLLSPGSVAAIRKVQGKPCADALPDLIRSVTTREVKIRRVTVKGDRATAIVAIPTPGDDQRATLTLRKVGAGWRIVLIGNE